MKKLIAVFAVLSLWTTIAVADEAPPTTETTPDPTTETTPEIEATPEPVDCSTLEGDEKTKCEEEQAAPEVGKTGKTGKSLNQSEDGRMESFDEDE